MTLELDTAARSHVGLRKANNEDSWLVAPASPTMQLLLVADGVTGRAGGEVASRLVAETFGKLAEDGKLAPATNPSLAETLLKMAAQKAHVKVAETSRQQPEYQGMASTLTLGLVQANHLLVMQVGDSVLLLWRDGSLKHLTEAQTVARALLADGRIGEDQLATHPDRNTLTQSIGLESREAPLEPVFSQCALAPGDLILVCSDGLTDLVDDEQLSAHLAAEPDLDALAERLIQAALDAGGSDNVTVVLCRLPAAGGGD